MSDPAPEDPSPASAGEVAERGKNDGGAVTNRRVTSLSALRVWRRATPILIGPPSLQRILCETRTPRKAAAGTARRRMGGGRGSGMS